MEHNSQFNIIEAQIRECFGRVVWTHKTLEKCADILTARNAQFRWCQIIISAIVSCGVFATVFGDVK